MLPSKAPHHPVRRSVLLRALALLVKGLTALLFSACLSPTLPLPPPDVNSMHQAQTAGYWTVSGTCNTGAIVTVFNERTGKGAVVEDRENTGFFSVVIEADPCDLAWAKQEEGQDASGRTTFTIQEKSMDLFDDPNACK
ncbi:MAG TPA: hypothetical protein VK459_18240 [Polyangiaceae bacterium]|nr:hypothetical protein [Polyangiaceae bacterium]